MLEESERAQRHSADGDGPWIYAGGGKMRRDDDYLRELMLELEASDEWLHPFALRELR